MQKRFGRTEQKLFPRDLELEKIVRNSFLDKKKLAMMIGITPQALRNWITGRRSLSPELRENVIAILLGKIDGPITAKSRGGRPVEKRGF